MQIIQDSKHVFECNIDFDEIMVGLPCDHPYFASIIFRMICLQCSPEIVKNSRDTKLIVEVTPRDDLGVYYVKVFNPLRKKPTTWMRVWVGPLEHIKAYLNNNGVQVRYVYKYKNTFCIFLPPALNASEWLECIDCHPSIVKEHGEIFIKKDANKILNEFY